MKRLVLGIFLLGSLLALPMPMMAQVNIHIGISLPPPIRFAEPPRMVVLPQSYVYVAPDISEDIFFYDGWWWRPWEGRWYRSHEYNSGWRHYKYTPSFYKKVPSGWRNNYRERRWREHRWIAEPVEHREVQKNWQNWKREKYWEKHHNWGVEDLRNQPISRQQQKSGSQFRQEDRNWDREHKRYQDHDDQRNR
jgi:hypothetical protein